MKGFLGCLRMDLRRAFLSRSFLISTLGMAAIYFYIVFNEISHGTSVVSVYYFNILMKASDFSLLALLICAVPYAASFCEDWNNQFIRPSCIRSSADHYCASKVLVCALSGGSTVVLVHIIASILCIVSNLTFSLGWGKIIGTLAQTGAGDQFGFKMIFYQIFMSYDPLQATLFSFFMSWMCGVFLGLVIFTFDMYFKRAVGAIAATVFLLLDLFVNNATSGPFISGGLFFSPVSWSNIISLDTTGTSTDPTMQYAVIVLVVIIVVLSTISIRAIKKKNIDVLPPV